MTYLLRQVILPRLIITQISQLVVFSIGSLVLWLECVLDPTETTIQKTLSSFAKRIFSTIIQQII